MKWYPLIRLKERIEYLLMQPFIWWGQWQAVRRPLEKEYDLYCFFSGYAMGGAEKLNASIVEAFPGKRILIFFTRHSANDALLSKFKLPNTDIKEIQSYTDNKWKYWQNFIYRGICKQYINSQSLPPVVLIGQCNFGYKVSPHLKKAIRQVEYIHVSEPAFARVTFPYIPWLNLRIASAVTIKNDYELWYDRLGMPGSLKQRWAVITNGVETIPETPIQKSFDNPLKVYYVGRGGPQKRVWLIAKIIEQCAANEIPVNFHLVGPVENEIPMALRQFATFYGIVKDPVQMTSMHASMHILLMTSALEGFPLAVMEAMSLGAIPMVTAVNALPEHVHHGDTGFLLRDPINEQAVVEQAVKLLSECTAGVYPLEAISANAQQYARAHFSPGHFADQWRDALWPKAQ